MGPNIFILSLLPYPLSLAFAPSPSTKRSWPLPRPPESPGSSTAYPPLTSDQHPPPNPTKVAPPPRSLPFLERSFARFGTHVARNQIRVLLISCLVITTLLYPALAVQYQTMVSSDSSSSVSRPRSMFNAPFLLPLFDPPRRDESLGEGENEFPFVQGKSAMEIWEEDAGWELEEAGQDGTEEAAWRVETVWVGDVMHLDETLSEGGIEPSTQIPIDPSRLIHTSNASSTLGLVHCRKLPPRAVLSLTHPWESWSCFFRKTEDGWNELAWTSLLKEKLGEESAYWGRVGQAGKSWKLRKIPSLNNSSYSDPTPTLAPSRPRSSIELNLWSIPPIMLLYGFLLASTFRSLQGMTHVHDRFGLAFTYVIELACSTTCSGSICVVMGWKLDGVPWFLLPFVIFVVGTENMAHVTRAVTSTPITLTVAERLSLGLQKCGPTITYSTICDIVLLQIFGLLVGEKVAPVREFSRFASIVLLADWFLIWTFFSNVISIDMQRLDLADLLRQGSHPPSSPSPASFNIPSSTNTSNTTPKHSPHHRPKERRRRRLHGRSRSLPQSLSNKSEALVSGFQAILRARAGRNGSLFILLLSAMGIWGYYAGNGWGAEGVGHGIKVGTGVGDGEAGWSKGSVDMLGPHSSLQELYSYLNPQRLPSISLHASPPTAFITFTSLSSPSARGFLAPKRQQRLNSLPHPSRSSSSPFSSWMSSPSVYFLKVVLFPIFSTTFALYLVLLYLLKDADLLDAQRDRLGIGEEWDDESETEAGLAAERSGATSGDAEDGTDGLRAGRGSEGKPTMRVLRGLHQADVCLLATSASGEVNVSVGFDGIAVVWRTEMPEIGERLLLPLSMKRASAGAKVLFAAVDEAGTFCALGFGEGGVFVWSIAKEQFGLTATPVPFTPAVVLIPQSTPSFAVPSTAPISPAPIAFIQFLPTSSVLSSHPTSTLIVAREDGRLFEFDTHSRAIHLVTLIPPSPSERYRASPLWSLSTSMFSPLSDPRLEPIRLALSSPGRVDVLRRDDPAAWTRSTSISLSSSRDVVNSLSLHQILIDHSLKPILALSLKSNTILLYDVNTSELLLTLPPTSTNAITRVQLLDPPFQRCSLCHDCSPPSFILLASTLHTLSVHRILHRPSPSSSDAACSCPAFRSSLTISDRTSFETSPFATTTPLRHRSSSSLSSLIPNASSPLPRPPPISPLLLTKRLPPSPSANIALSLSAADYPQASHGVHSRRLSRRNDLEDTSFESSHSHATSNQEDILTSSPAQPSSSSSASSPSEQAPSSSSSAVASPIAAAAPPLPLALTPVLLGPVNISRGGWDVTDERFVVGVGKGSSIASSGASNRPSLDDPRPSTSSIRSNQSSNSIHPSLSRQWTLFSLDLHDPTAGPDLALTHHALFSLASSLPTSPTLSLSQIPSSSSPIADTPGASLRRRRNFKLAEAATRALPPPEPTISHTVVGPFATIVSSLPSSRDHMAGNATGERTLLFGLGNSFGRVDWPASPSTSSKSTQSSRRPSSSPSHARYQSLRFPSSLRER